MRNQSRNLSRKFWRNACGTWLLHDLHFAWNSSNSSLYPALVMHSVEFCSDWICVFLRRLSYHQRIVDIVPANFSPLIPANPIFTFKYGEESKFLVKYDFNLSDFVSIGRISQFFSILVAEPVLLPTDAQLPGYPMSITVSNAIKNRASNEEILAVLKDVPNPNQEDDDGWSTFCSPCCTCWGWNHIYLKLHATVTEDSLQAEVCCSDRRCSCLGHPLPCALCYLGWATRSLQPYIGWALVLEVTRIWIKL